MQFVRLLISGPNFLFGPHGQTPNYESGESILLAIHVSVTNDPSEHSARHKKDPVLFQRVAGDDRQNRLTTLGPSNSCCC